MSSTVQVGKFDISSNHESAAEMVASLTPPRESDGKPTVKRDGGKAVEPEEAKATEAARELGKRGGEAAAKAREERAKESDTEKDKGEDTKDSEVKPKPKETKAEDADRDADTPEAKSRARARVEQATRQLAEEKRARALEQQELRDLKDRLARLERGDRPAAETPKVADGKPILDDYSTHEEWVEALTDWKADQREKKHAEEAKVRESVERWKTRLGTFQERVEKAVAGDVELGKELWPLLESMKTRDMLTEGEWEKLSGHQQAAVDLADEIMDCERPMEVMRFLVRNPAEYERLVTSKDAYALRRAFGRMEAMLDREEAPAPVVVERRPSNAPAPLRPVSPTVQPGEPDYTKEMSFDQYAKLKGRK